MKKLLLGLALCLTGCLNTTNHNPMTDNRSKEQPWWQAKVEPGTPKDKNPWMAFVRDMPEDRWYDPWSQIDLKAYGVTPIKSAVGTSPLKDAKIRMLKLELKQLKKKLKQAEDKKTSHSSEGKVY
jgi:hypothetical protein